MPGNLAGVSGARDAAERCVSGAIPYLPSRAYDRFNAPKQARYDETYTLPENLFYAYETTGDENYRELARKYLMDGTYFDPLSRGENVLPGLHAYSHVNALCSASRAYLVLGEPKYLQAAQNAWEMITKTQSYASGGWGPNEEFVAPNKGLMGASLTGTREHFETPCGTYAHLKLTRYLLRFTAEGRYGDSLERVLYNTVLGIKEPKGDGHVFYYSDYHPATQKTYYPSKWPCCSGTTPQVVADYVISAYFRAADGIYVNLCTPSEVDWKIQGAPVKLTQTTAYPESDSTELRVDAAAPVECTIYVRIPGWRRCVLNPGLRVHRRRCAPGRGVFRKAEVQHLPFGRDGRPGQREGAGSGRVGRSGIHSLWVGQPHVEPRPDHVDSDQQQPGLAIPSVSEQDAADLYAFFYAARYFSCRCREVLVEVRISGIQCWASRHGVPSLSLR